jgi:hypothetical protein
MTNTLSTVQKSIPNYLKYTLTDQINNGSILKYAVSEKAEKLLSGAYK